MQIADAQTVQEAIADTDVQMVEQAAPEAAPTQIEQAERPLSKLHEAAVETGQEAVAPSRVSSQARAGLGHAGYYSRQH